MKSAIEAWTEEAARESKDTRSKMCFCMGPQNGDPACPCKMKELKIVNGRYVKIIDYGPVRK